MRTLGSDIGVYILLQAVLHEASTCTLGQVTSLWSRMYQKVLATDSATAIDKGKR